MMNVIFPNGFFNRHRNSGNSRSNVLGKLDFSEKSSRDITTALREQTNHRIFEAHERIRQQQQEQRRSRRRQTGSVRLSNTDSISRAKEVRGRLISKIQEIAASDMEPRARDAMIADIQMMIDRVEQKIAAIRRRERAIQEEQIRRRTQENPEERRRRMRDMQERHMYVRRDLLHHADKGGFDPNNPLGGGFMPFNPSSAVSVEIGGQVGSMDISGMSMSAGTEVVL